MQKNKKNKLKTYVLMVSNTFPSFHPKAGKKTGFESAILTKKKKHTIRENYSLWAKRIDEINAGKAILSVRKWSGKPYHSKQVKIIAFTKLGYEKVIVYSYGDPIHIRNFNKPFDKTSHLLINGIARLAKNDGLTLHDFQFWFKNSKQSLLDPGIIIHFTNMRYVPQAPKVKLIKRNTKAYF